MSLTSDQIRSLRLGMDLTQAEAAAIAKVSPRTWAAWESGSRNMPFATLDFFVLRITHSADELEAKNIKIRSEHRGLVVLFDEDQNGFQIPIDVVAKDNFLDITLDASDPTRRIISSLAVKDTGKPYVHRTSVSRFLNQGGIERLMGWKQAMESQG